MAEQAAEEFDLERLAAPAGLSRFHFQRLFETVPDARLSEPTDVLVRVTRACICGSDLWPYKSMEPSDAGVVMGHEAIGIVEEVGKDVRNLKRGDFVVMAEQIIIMGRHPDRVALALTLLSLAFIIGRVLFGDLLNWSLTVSTSARFRHSRFEEPAEVVSVTEER